MEKSPCEKGLCKTLPYDKFSKAATEASIRSCVTIWRSLVQRSDDFTIEDCPYALVISKVIAAEAEESGDFF